MAAEDQPRDERGRFTSKGSAVVANPEQWHKQTQAEGIGERRSKADAHAKLVKAETKKLTDEEQSAVRHFTSHHYANMRALQQGQTKAEIVNKAIAEKVAKGVTDIDREWETKQVEKSEKVLPAFESAIAKMKPAETAPVVYRGMSVPHEVAEKILKSGELTINAHSSASANARHAFEFAQQAHTEGHTPIIMAIKHKTGRGIESMSVRPNEREVILSKGSKYKVKASHFVPATFNFPPTLHLELEES